MISFFLRVNNFIGNFFVVVCKFVFCRFVKDGRGKVVLFFVVVVVKERNFVVVVGVVGEFFYVEVGSFFVNYEEEYYVGWGDGF